MPSPAPGWPLLPWRGQWGGGGSGRRKTKGGKGGGLGGNLVGAPLVWKTPRAKRQLCGSEETGDINPGLSLLFPSCLFLPGS